MSERPTGSGGNDFAEDLAWLLVAGLALLAGKRVWETRARPWVADHFGFLDEWTRGGNWVGLAVLAVPLVVVLLVARSSVRRARRRRKLRKEAQQRARDQAETSGWQW